MSTRDKIAVMRAKAVNHSRDVPCPECNACTLLRGDSGLCERCHAKRPEARAEWEAHRRSIGRKAEFRRSKRLPPGTCFICQEPYGSMTPFQHDKRCPARPFPCVCGLRYWNEDELKAHGYTCRMRLLEEIRGET